MKISLNEHNETKVFKITEGSESINCIEEFDFENLMSFERRFFLPNVYPFKLRFNNDGNFYEIKADYYVGLDWLVKGKKFVQVEPKINLQLVKAFDELVNISEDQSNEEIESQIESQLQNDSEGIELLRLDYLQMLLTVYSADISNKQIGDLVKIYWKDQPIKILQKEDQLTPFLVVQFLSLLKSIVRKGLKKSYYKVRENLSNRVKGKILVGQQIKQNVFKNRQTKTYCEYQVFSENNRENQFLKKVLSFCTSYVENHGNFFASNQYSLEHMINYCRAAFEFVSSDLRDNEIRNFKHNPFFKEYKEAVAIGNQILKRFAYNISSTTDKEIETPPFWIDMPRLFELYFYAQLIKNNFQDKNYIEYQFSTYGNALDFLVAKDKISMVIDAKYKLHYKSGKVHSDIRQVSGYARLNKVLDKIKKMGSSFDTEKVMPCLIVYPNLSDGLELDQITLDMVIQEKVPIKTYHEVFKLGIKLPLIR